MSCNPAKIVKLASEYEVAVGQSVSLNCQAEGNPKPTYAWNPCERVCHESTLNIPGVVSDGIYTCKVTNGLESDTKHTSVAIASTLINVTLTITSERCNDGKYNQSLLWRKLNKTIKEVFASESGYNSARLVNVRCGSVVVDLALKFSSTVRESKVLSLLRDAAKNGMFGDFHGKSSNN
ncbi:Vascular cell adhesion [Desmophyllum pertusum]|uniref:Vascular cell adhesion n=1 Tax=Desmophyllum pertusum TaxID=174260 RepID=A0A9W9ZXF2_9CNID|nr:Vascular cell adhesion [Desmophyllum pertusum]